MIIGTDWGLVYVIIGWTLAAAAIALAIWALFWDRPRGKRRCPQCWYDLSGTPGLRCSECGREAASEKKLLRTRRCWRYAALAALVAVAGYATGSIPAYRNGGWVAMVPSSVLVLIAPGDNRAAATFYPGLVGTTSGVITLGAPGGTAPLSTSQRLSNEVWSRLEKRRLARWQSQLFLGRHLRATGTDLMNFVDLPTRWPVGEVIPVLFRNVNIGPARLAILDRNAQWRGERAIWLAPGRATNQPVSLKLGLQYRGLVYRTTRPAPVTIAGSRDSLLERVTSTEVDRLVASALEPHLTASDAGTLLIIRDRSEKPAWQGIDFGLSYTFEITIGQEVVGTGAGTTNWRTPVWKDWDEIAVKWVGQGRERVTREPAAITVRGDFEGATTDYITWPFDKPRAACWTGTFTSPLELKPHPGNPAK